MSIEAKLDALREAVEANTAVHANILQLLKKGGSAGGAAAAADKPAATKPAASKATKPAAITIDKVKKVFTEFLGVEDKKLREQRKEQVGAICAHFGAERATAIDEEHWAAALKAVKQLEAGETPDFMEADEDGDEDGGDDDALV